MDPFATRELGRTGLRLTQLGLGGTSVGSMYVGLDDDEGRAVVERAWDLGARYYDTAPYYGAGSSERRFGQALKGKPRSAFVLSTKVGRLLVPDSSGEGKPAHFADREPYRAVFDFSPDGVRRSVEESLQRLGLDSIDVAYAHDPQGHVYQIVDETFPALAKMKEEGLIKAIGAGVNFSEVCQLFLRFCEFDCFLLAMRYTLLEQAPLAEFLPLCQEKGVGVVVGGALASGILATGPVPGAHYNYRPAPPSIVERVRRIEHVCQAHGVPLAAAALQFPLGHPAVASVITGSNLPEHMDANAELMRRPIPPAFWADLKSERLLNPQAPTPA
jgi:D-threo-aldose 1-dehydrogenase